MSSLTMHCFFVLVCVGFLTSQPCIVSGLRSKDLALRWNNSKSSLVATDDWHSQLKLAPAPSMTFDPNQPNKRTVRKGSDPIHNRC
ncbi:hypothetical protein Fmac_008708 [Flemingia macrophylla]|uniref:Uncharacterized protein n=1 Tax=Flemingia macrophylla TaxID=520843 RepID=A0ABD1MY70_9FABA